ncbi:DUF7544 domain-containing protein [Halorubrum tropicale]|uniref:Glycerophosphoryl diester phosphodiesterase membrane domain-containing protein n=1 Tax=Halorubrum tropicale TaxID=1765655 RepID=A0A0N0BQW1_9EURY|nr:hypothetical protein [Halorubrum tropicale]KOX95974.1 hypothetical protein AMR74_10515 [Halorubrum tropicale]
MTLYAVDAIDDAIDATRSLLWPFDVGRWLRLMLVVFFVGGAGGSTTSQFGGSASTGSGPQPGSLPQPYPPETVLPGGAELLVIGAVLAAVAAVVLGLLFVGSVMEFVFVESLRREAVSIRRYWRDRWRAGVRLFGFRLLLGAITLTLAGAVLTPALLPALSGEGSVAVGLLLLAAPVLLGLTVVSGLVGGFTTNFVVPVMLVEERSVVSAWRRFWPVLTGQWKQYAAYVALAFVLRTAAGVLSAVAVVFGVIAAAIPFGITGAVGLALLSVATPVGAALIAVSVVLFVLAVVAVALFVSVPVQTYLRYYALFVLGDTDAEFDLIAERRRAVRE